MKPTLTIVKVGGHILSTPPLLKKFIAHFSTLPDPKILVHGGGQTANQLAEQLGIPVNKKEGRRITNADTLSVVTMVYAGTHNKQLVSQLQATGCDAIGLTGADGNFVISRKRPSTPTDFGFVGDITRVHTQGIHQLLETGYVPVFCGLTHDGCGQLLNTNADSMAAEIASAMASYYKVSLHYCFELAGVLMDPSDPYSVIPLLNKPTYQTLVAEERISDGMIPKLSNCFYALEQQVNKVTIGSVDSICPTQKIYTTIEL